MAFMTIAFTSNYRSKAIFLTLSLLLLIIAACSGAKQTVTQTGASESELEKQRIEELEFERKKNWSFGGTAFLQKNYQDALKYLLIAKELDMQLDPERSEYPLIYKYLGGTYHQLDQPDEALENLQIFIKYDPEDASTNETLIWHYQKLSMLDKYEEQVLHYLPLVQDITKKKTYFRNLKKVYNQLGKNEKALNIVNQLLELEPDNKELIDERIGLLKKTGGSEAVKSDLVDKAKKYPNDLSYKWELVQIYEDESEYDNALEMLDQILTVEKDNVDVLERKLRIYWDHQQDEANSVRILNELIRIKPGDPGYVTRIAGINLDNGKYREAVNEAEKALAIDKNFREAVFIKASAIYNFADNIVRENENEVRYQDRLVFNLAYTLYQEASKDPALRVKAKRYADYLKENYVPTEENKFLHKGEDIPTDPAYRWLLKYF
ncbi:MAG: hypothetical protein GY863_06225 [bacterium]|nr:hypothetical protein [bacterium]